MAVNKVNLYVSQIIEDLNNGLTWLKKDDLGYGSIEVKYGANEKQILAIRKHPSLKDVETNITIFNVIDDTKDNKKNEAVNKAKEPTPARSTDVVEQPMVSVDGNNTTVGVDSELSAFVNL